MRHGNVLQGREAGKSRSGVLQMSNQSLKWWHWLLASCGLSILGVVAARFAIFHRTFALLILAIVAWTFASASFAMAVIRFVKSAWSNFGSSHSKQT
jgi:hypothetical protein